MGNQNLKPCPFCGAEAEITRSGDEYELVCAVGCTQCSARVRVSDDTVDRDGDRLEAEAVAEWNKRADERGRAPLLDLLRKCKGNFDDFGKAAIVDGLDGTAVALVCAKMSGKIEKLLDKERSGGAP